MPLIKIQHYPGLRQVLIASEEISHLAVVEISPVGSQYVALGSDNVSGRIAGVAWGAQSGAVSGKAIRVLTQGIASGVVCASSINVGDRVTCVSGGRINFYNVITPAGTISGILVSGVGGAVLSGQWGLSGFILSGYTTAVDIITGRILGKALASGTKDGGIPVLVDLA